MKCKNMKLENMSCLNVDSVLDHLDSLNVKKWLVGRYSDLILNLFITLSYK